MTFQKMKPKDLNPALVAGCSRAQRLLRSIKQIDYDANKKNLITHHIHQPKAVSNNSYGDVCSGVHSSDWFGFN